MSDIPKTYVTTYNNNVRMKLNQLSAKLAPLALQEDGKGEMQLLDNLVGNDDVTKRTTRNADTSLGETEHDRVWAAQPGADEYARLVDSLDKVASGIDLQGTYVKGGSQALLRARDGAFLGGFDGTTGFYGNMLMGKTGGTIVPFANGNIVPVAEGASTATGLNVAKMIAAREILASNYVDMDEPFYMAVSAKQVSNLYNQVEVTSEEFKRMGGRLSADGKKLIGFLGFEFVELELSNPRIPYASTLSLDGSGYRKTPFWAKSGMAMVWWEKLFTSIDRRADKGHAIQVFARQMVTATRTDNGKCGIVLNDE